MLHLAEPSILKINKISAKLRAWIIKATGSLIRTIILQNFTVRNLEHKHLKPKPKAKHLEYCRQSNNRLLQKSKRETSTSVPLRIPTNN